MPASAARAAEADKASVAFHAALTQIGVGAVADALTLWDEMPAAQSKPALTGPWLRKAIDQVLKRRKRSRQLAVAYYRLVRALHTDRTVRLPTDVEPAYVTLGELRREFSEAVEASAVRSLEGLTATPETIETAKPAEPVSEAHSPSDSHADDDSDRIISEEIARLAEAEAEMERAIEEELRIDLAALGPSNLDRQLGAIDDSQPATDVDGERDRAHSKAGARQAATAARVAMDGARSEVWTITQRDKRAVGYIRLSRTGTPCGWCAMLISRGPVYKTEASATYSDGDQYHDNCHCYAEPVFSRQQYDQSDRYALNRQYAQEWPRVTRGLQGKAALSAWRYYIRQQEKTTQRAQAARTTPIAQEA